MLIIIIDIFSHIDYDILIRVIFKENEHVYFRGY